MEEDVRFETWQECFSALPDPRVVGRTWHKLLDILFLTLCAVMSGFTMAAGGTFRRRIPTRSPKRLSRTPDDNAEM